MNTETAVISIEKLSRKFGSKIALQGISLEVQRGGVLGLVGANGAGKTTLIKHVLGLLKAKEGTVRVLGLDPVKNAVKVLSGIGYLSEDRDLPPWLSVRELLRYSQTFYDSWDASYAEHLRGQFQLDPGSLIRTLSKGELAKAGLLVALAHRPELLVLDEPSSGLDPVVRRELLEAIVRAVGDEGRTVLFSSHLLEEIARVSDRVAMIAHGRLVLNGELNEVLESHRRMVVRWPGTLDSLKALPGTLSVTGGPEEWSVICNGGAEEFLAALRNANGVLVEDSTATFEEVFHARVTGKQV